jgi:hypothetical protein
MTWITQCPQCTEELGVPKDTLENAEVQCPICKFAFSMDQAYPGNLPKIIIKTVNDPAVLQTDTMLSAENTTNPLFSTKSSRSLSVEKKNLGTNSVFLHFSGIIFFGILGIVLGLGVLLFLGKALPIIQILPESGIKNWLKELNH